MADRWPPHVPKELVEYLERIFPDRCPAVDVSDRDVWLDAGSARVVRHLRKAWADQDAASLGVTE